MGKIKIGIVDDHQIVIDGLKLLLSSEENFEIVIECIDSIQLLEILQNTKIDILLTDIIMPSLNGYELSKLVRQKFPEIKIIALSMNGDGALIYKMIEDAQISGYLLKTTNKKNLISAIDKVYQGGQSFDDEIIFELDKYSSIKKKQEQIHLTARELEIISCIANDLSNKQIASELFISERTVETHRKNILRKTNTHSVVSLLDFLRKMKIIS
jgi:two-component system, NarL family, nitrate/nitrite response regulator NarL